MAKYIEFPTDSGAILVEVSDDANISDEQGFEVGLGDTARQLIGKAQEKLEDAVQSAVASNVTALLKAMKALPTPPDEIELSFSLKATGETGALAWGIAKLVGEANYGVKVIWKKGSEIRV